MSLGNVHKFLYCNIKLVSTSFINRLKPKDGPYQACIKFAEIQSMVQEQFTTFRMTTQEVQQAFPGARSERSTFVFGVRRRQSTSAGHEVGAPSLPVRPVQAQEVSTLQTVTQNAALLQQVSELEAKMITCWVVT